MMGCFSDFSWQTYTQSWKKFCCCSDYVTPLGWKLQIISEATNLDSLVI